MPLRDDLLVPIEGTNPSGANLQYDKVFDQIKEARVEDDDSIPLGSWERAPKKADRSFVIKVAGEALAQRSKDLRLASWYAEALLRKEGFSVLCPSIEFLYKLQEQFWETVYPELDKEDGSADLRIGAIEGASILLAASVKSIALTRNGMNWLQCQDARALGLEADSMSDEKAAVRADAIRRNKPTGDDLKKAFENTPKAFYAETEAVLLQSLAVIDEMERFHEEKYGNDYPSMAKLRSSIGDVRESVYSVLNEKRKTDPDPVAATEPADAEAGDNETDRFAQYDVTAAAPNGDVAQSAPAAPRKLASGALAGAEQAYSTVAACAQFLRTEDVSSPIPYLLCSALRLGETRNEDIHDLSFAIAPSREVRQALRRLASESRWDDLMQLCLKTLTEPCGRMWLDLQRYTWRAAYETGNYNVAAAVLSVVRGLLTDKPGLRQATLDDDTPAANAETSDWLDSEVLPPAQGNQAVREEPRYEFSIYEHRESGDEEVRDIYQTAVEVLKQGKVSEAINMLVRDSELQRSGRMRFQRRVQMAELCLAADQAAVAYPVLMDLSNEMERRGLDTWESGETLAQPLSLLLRCLDLRQTNPEDREATFARLCRIDPQAALSLRR